MTTAQAMKYLIEKELGITLILSSNVNVHIFKDVKGIISKGEYGNGDIVEFDYWNYKDSNWIRLIG